jgi:glycosyltransferase involved in cell wall biosynthesis
MKRDEILVSVDMITYNHEAYIAQAIEGVLNQITNFKYELVIANDCSPDETDEIVKRYINSHPKGYIIKYYKHNQNIGMHANGNFAYSKCSGKYIALCEGDDYWTDPYKLQKQVDFLEANPDYALCFHPIKIEQPDGSIIDDFITEPPANYEYIETLAAKGNYIHTPSVVFKNILEQLPDAMQYSPIGDYFLYMLLAEHGKLKQLPDAMAVYRRHNQGVHSLIPQARQNEKWFTMLYYMIPSFEDDVRTILINQLKEMGVRILSNITDLSAEMETNCVQFIKEYDSSFSIDFRTKLIQAEKKKQRKKLLLKPFYYLKQQLNNLIN